MASSRSYAFSAVATLTWYFRLINRYDGSGWSGRDLAGEDLCAQLRIDLLIQALCAVADYAHAQNPDCLVIVDNTFSTPLLVQPLKLGADVVVHSATKYLNSHGDVVAGFSVAHKEIMEQIRMVGLKDITGAVLGPQEAFLILRGRKTLKVHMDAVCANTQKVVDFLAGSKYVQKVFYPSLENHPDHAVAVREMTRFGGVVSFEMGRFEEAKKVLNHVHLCARWPSASATARRSSSIRLP